MAVREDPVPRPRPGLLPWLLLSLLLALTGCGNDEPAETDGGPETSTSAEPTEEGTEPSGDSPTTDQSSPTSTVPPAGGIRLRVEGISASAPKGWEPDDIGSSHVVTAGDPRGINFLTLQHSVSVSGSDDLRSVAQEALKYSSWSRKPKILEPTEIDGVEVYHLSGRSGSATFVEAFGAPVDDGVVSLELVMSDDQSAEERQRILDSVLQTVEIG